MIFGICLKFTVWMQTLYMNEFGNKCKSKGLNPLDFKKKLAERIPQYKGRWAKSMNEQIHDLPDFEQVERETLRNLKSLLKN